MTEQPVPGVGIHIRAEQPTAVVRARYYPEMPPGLPGETDAQYTERLTGADRTERRPYDHCRNRQCSIGYHEECSDPAGEICECPCHQEQVAATDEEARRLERQKPIIEAAVKLAIRWRDWDGTENMVPWINALCEAVDRSTLDAVAEAIKKGEV